MTAPHPAPDVRPSRLRWTVLAETSTAVVNGVVMTVTITATDGRYHWTIAYDGGVCKGSSKTRRGARAAVYRNARLDAYIMGILRKKG